MVLALEMPAIGVDLSNGDWPDKAPAMFLIQLDPAVLLADQVLLRSDLTVSPLVVAHEPKTEESVEILVYL